MPVVFYVFISQSDDAETRGERMLCRKCKKLSQSLWVVVGGSDSKLYFYRPEKRCGLWLIRKLVAVFCDKIEQTLHRRALLAPIFTLVWSAARSGRKLCRDRLVSNVGCGWGGAETGMRTL